MKALLMILGSLALAGWVLAFKLSDANYGALAGGSR